MSREREHVMCRYFCDAVQDLFKLPCTLWLDMNEKPELAFLLFAFLAFTFCISFPATSFLVKPLQNLKTLI